MPKVSRQSATHVEDHGVVEDRSDALEGYRCGFTTFRERVDMTPILAGLPGGVCACPHWGHVLTGSATVRYADHVETLEEGDAFYMPPGHVPTFEAGTEVLMFSPADELAATDAAIQQHMRSLQQA